MRPRLRQAGWALLVCMALAHLATGPASGQETLPPKAPAAAEAASEDTLQGEVLPKVFYLKDADGNLQAMLGWTYERVMELWRQQRQLIQENERPPYSIQRCELSGTAAGDSAELVARFTIAVHQSGWVGVPLRLNDAVLREAPTYQGSGEFVLDVDPERLGHIAWLDGEADTTHELTCKLVVPLEQIGPQSRLRLAVPQAGVSQLYLQVPLERTAAEVSEGATLDTVRSLAGGKTELKVIGLAGDFELTWHPADSKVASLPTILQASSAQLIVLNGRSINTETKLTVRSLGSEFDHFQVRLPPGADYIGTPQSGPTLVAVDVSAPGGKLYDVKLDKKTVGPVEVRLVTERAHAAGQADDVLELGGFEVLGAVRQWGTIGVQVDGNWQVVWGETNNVRRIDEKAARRALSAQFGGSEAGSLRPADEMAVAARGDELAAGFEYFAQPYSLSARIVPQKTRLRVEPEYVLQVGSDEVKLEARLKYMIHGAKVRFLDIELPGWKLDAVGPNNVVDVDAAMTAGDDSPAIPLLQETGGDLEITLEAHQRIEPGSDVVSLDFPRLDGETVSADVTVEAVSADVAVVSDDNVELVPRLEETTDLAPQTVRSQMKLPQRQQEPLYYRTTAESARFVADMKVHQQEVSAALATRLSLSKGNTDVEQLLALQIAYVPADHFSLVVPRGVRPERLTVLYEGQRIVPVPTRVRLDRDEPITTVRA